MIEGIRKRARQPFSSFRESLWKRSGCRNYTEKSRESQERMTGNIQRKNKTQDYGTRNHVKFFSVPGGKANKL